MVAAMDGHSEIVRILLNQNDLNTRLQNEVDCTCVFGDYSHTVTYQSLSTTEWPNST